MQVRSLRLLFVSRPLAGHFEPLVPLARAARAGGHSVAFATGEPWAARARERGFEAFRAGTDEGFRTEWAPQFPGFADLVGDAQRRFFFGQIFADLELVPRADDLHPIVERWKPNGLIHEMADLSAPLVASAHDLFYADVSFGPLIPLSVLSAAAEAAEPHWRDRGLRPLPWAGLFRHLYLDTCPPSLQSPEVSTVGAQQLLRPAVAEVPDAQPPAWLQTVASTTSVYLTMGTTWNEDLGVFRSVIEALEHEDLSLIVTVGRQNDPAALGPLPANVIADRYIPQGVLLPHCAAVVAHGGAGTTLGALAFGVPLVLLPQGADQYANAERVVAAGAGRQLLRHERTADELRAAVLDVAYNPAYRQAARRIQAEIHAMPDASNAISRIEGLVLRG